MKTETFEVEEIKGELGNMAADSEATELIQELNLEGQKKLLNVDTATRFPYPRLTHLEEKVYETILPVKTILSDYNSGIIPLRVLQVIKHAKEFPQCAYMYVWHPKDNSPDPLLVGKPQQYGGEIYKLARWGDVLLPFEHLHAKAIKMRAAALRMELKVAIMKLTAIQSSVEDHVRSRWDEGCDGTFYISGI